MIDRSLFNPLWGAVANARPRLRPHVALHRHVYRGQVWQVLQDPVSGRFHRFGPGAYLLISRLDGQRRLDDVWQEVVGTLGDEAPTQDEVIQLLGTLHSVDALEHDGALDLEALFERRDRHRRRQWLQKVRSPLAIRIPLFDPDRFLDITFPLVRPLFSLFGLLLWLVVVGSAAVMAVMHWEGLTDDIASRVLAVDNLPVLVCVFILVKAIHELGHGYMLKRWGGEVHELGIMLLVFMPVPYVDASASTAFVNKWQRAAVGSAGILVELLLAALAMFVWREAEEGMVRAIAFNVMVVGGVSTLLFNGNPLLRFDGYYVFADLVEIPNLFMRANRYVFYLIQRHLFGMAEARSPVTAAGERGWLFCYAIASFCYRMFLMTVIVMFVASRFFTLGILLAVWAVAQMILWPVLKGLTFLFTSPRLERRRGRAWFATACVLGGLLVPLALVPVPRATVVEGMLWVPEDAVVHASASGFIGAILAVPGKPVTRGDLLVRLEAPFLDTEIRLLEAQVRELEVQRALAAVEDRVQERIHAEEISVLQARLDEARERREELVITSPADGIFALPQSQHLPGRFLRQGEQLAVIVDPRQPVARGTISQDRIELVMTRTNAVAVRTAANPENVFDATSLRLVPAASQQLPSLVLSQEGGGALALDPTAREGMRTLEPFFEVEALVPGLAGTRAGGRLYLRFDHGRAPLGEQLYRSIRQTFLEKLNV